MAQDGKAAVPDERSTLDARRTAVDGDPGSRCAYWGLALSGGGIRSATFALGVLQAVARRRVDGPGAGAVPGSRFRASLLSRFDLLSTVSGGGYIGAFLCSLFQPGRLRRSSTTPAAAADDAVAVLAGGAPRRIGSHAYRDGDGRCSDDVVHAPLAWLRENGRYLVPTGVGDAFYAAALGLRGWIALHVVVGTLLLFVLALLGALRASLPVLAAIDGSALQWAGGAGCAAAAAAEQAKALLWSSPSVDVALYAAAGAKAAAAASFPVWWSASFAIAALPLAWALAVGVAFWMTTMDAGGRSRPLNVAFWGMVAAVAVFVGLAVADAGPALRAAISGAPAASGASDALAAVDRLLAAVPPRGKAMLALAAVALAGALYHAVHAVVFPDAAKQRASLTRQLAAALVATLSVVAIGAVETLGQSAYLWLLDRSWAKVTTPAALVAALVWLVRQLSGLGSGAKPGGWLARLPLPALGGLAGIVIFAAIAAAWSLALTALSWGGARPACPALGTSAHRDALWALAAAFGLIAAVTGRFPGFINLSSLQSFYAARLTRAYLGASNGRRFEQSAEENPKARTAAEPIAGDNLELSAFVDAAGTALSTWAPLHIVNVTLNKTVDPADQLVQRDRKGQPLAVLPWGYAVDGVQEAFTPAAAGADEIARPLSLGQWIGTSGAAFSTGIGRETSLGMSLLMGAANVRLGTWWESGRGERPPARGWQAVGAALARVFKTQTYVSYEFRARFHGLRREWQYLSDGGHFENTALYELLRPGRGVGFVLACDDGADPDYRFDDLANLIRLARIDLGVEVEVVDPASERLAFERPGGAGPVFGRPADFRTAAQARAAGKPNPLALLLRARDCGSGAVTWVVMVKPAWHADAPADVAQYALQHPAFPQEPTTDQFFDEAQWESYRQLGHHIAEQVLDARVLDVLLARIDERQQRANHRRGGAAAA